MSQEWISTKKAAELIGVSQRTIQNWVDDGKLMCSKTAGGHRRLNPDEVSKFLKSNQLPYTLNPKPSPTPLDVTNNKKMRILIVEDDLTILRLCELRFSQFSIPHDLHLATNAYQALIVPPRFSTRPANQRKTAYLSTSAKHAEQQGGDPPTGKYCQSSGSHAQYSNESQLN